MNLNRELLAVTADLERLTAEWERLAEETVSPISSEAEYL
jgi:hypothetical protein